MHRRTILRLTAAASLMPTVGWPQQAVRTYKLGWLSSGAPRNEPYNIAFMERLRELGFAEGRNLVVEYRSADGRVDKLPGLAADLARQKCDIYLAPGPEATLVAIRSATLDEPIIISANDYDPVASGHVASLARPGGRVTGVYLLQEELSAKRLELMKELLPHARRFAVLADSATERQLALLRIAAKTLGVDLLVHQFRQAPYDFEAAFVEFARAKAEAVLPLGSGLFVTARRKLPELALRYRLPGMFNNALWAEAGGLMSYGVDFSAAYRRAAEMVGLVFNGAKPAELPVEQSTVIELVINMRTAKVLGTTLPQGIFAGEQGDRMKRRDYLCAAASGLLLVRCPALAETAERVYRVGILRPSPPPLPYDKTANGIPDALRELGYLEGRNIVIERLYADGKPERLPGLVGELLKAKVEVVIAVSSPAVQAVRAASATLPIVMYGNFDPVALGLVASLARPGGNVTGVLIAPDGYLAGKRLELLKAAVPQATRFAYLGPPADPSARLQLVETKKAAASLGIEVADVEVRNGDYERAFVAIAAQRPEALFVAAHTLFVRDRMQIIQLAAKYKLPATYEWREQVADGGLMTYSTSLSWIYQRLASYVDRLLKGAKPGDLPIERPTKFELVINLKTARALGLAIPRSLLLRADEVIG